MSYAYCTAGIVACSASDLVPSRPRSTETDSLLLAQLPPRAGRLPGRRNVVAYVSEMGDGVTWAKVVGSQATGGDEHEIGDRVPPHSWCMVMSQD